MVCFTLRSIVLFIAIWSDRRFDNAVAHSFSSSTPFRHPSPLAFLEHIKKRKQLLEEELKKSGKLVNHDGKPVHSSNATILDSQGMPISSQQDKPMHFTEDLDQAMQSRSQGTSRAGEGRGKHATATTDFSNGKAKKVKKAGNQVEAMDNVYDAKEGDTIEICPDASILTQDIIMWLEETRGRKLLLMCCLFIENGIME